MGSSRYVGRVGALALALGIGAAVANNPGVAAGEPADPSTSSSSDSQSSSSSSPESGSAATDTSSPGSSSPTHDVPRRHRRPLNRPRDVAVSSSGGLTSPTAESSPTDRAASVPPAGGVRRARSGPPGVVVATGGRHSLSSGSSASAAPTTADAKPTSTLSTGAATTSATVTAATPDANADVPRGLRADSRRWFIAGAAPAPGLTAAADVEQPSTSTNPPVASALGATQSVPDANADAAVPEPPAELAATLSTSTPVDTALGIVSTLFGGVVSSFAKGAPTTPVEAPALWTLLAFARREFDRDFSILSSTVNPLAAQPTTGLPTDIPTRSSQSIDPAITTNLGAPTPTPAAQTVNMPLDATAAPAIFTGRPSILSHFLSAVFRIVGAVGEFLGVDLTLPITGLLQSDKPPGYTTRGLTVQRSEFEGMPVWTLQSPGSTSDEIVVAVHGGGLVLEPTIFNWLFYAAIARDTGATVIVPLYPLVQQGGTAGTVVPAVADLISAQIDQHGAENVSVFGDSAGANIALVAVQEIVRRGDPVPSRMVLSSPPLDATLSNPDIQSVNDPILSGRPTLLAVLENSRLWADGLDLTDPLVSPLFGSLVGLPPTTVYAGSRDVVAPDVLLLQEKALATPGADFTFVLRNGEPHDWAILTILPETRAVLPDIYQQLGITS